MIPSSSVRAYVCVEPVDMRKQIDGLAQMVQSVFAADAFGGQVFVFLGKRRNKGETVVVGSPRLFSAVQAA